MYKASVRWMVRRNIRLLSEGRYKPALRMIARNATLTFPGDNSWSRQFRQPVADRDNHPTHIGRHEIEAFLQRFVENGLKMEVEDVLVNGPPWNLRAAVRVHDWIPDGKGGDLYANRAVLMVRLRWGRLVEQEDYEDTERVTALDAASPGTQLS